LVTSLLFPCGLSPCLFIIEPFSPHYAPATTTTTPPPRVASLGLVAFASPSSFAQATGLWGALSRAAEARALAGAEGLVHDNAYERTSGRQIGDGVYAHDHLVAAHLPTRFALRSGAEADWQVAARVAAPQGASKAKGSSPATAAFEAVGAGLDELTHTFTEVGDFTLRATRALDGQVFEFAVSSRVARMELRALTTEHRELFLDALHTFYATGQEEGEKLYGANYKSLTYLVREHLYGAADKACDHWHDDAGLLTHHVGITWEFEHSLRLIEPRTAAHYWDYSQEHWRGEEWWQSPIFNDDWLSTGSPANAEHVEDSGRFAYTPVLTNASSFSDITNPYGLLRSPWNTNPTPYLMRSNKTMSVFGDGVSMFPGCGDFSSYLSKSLADVLGGLNGALHGPIHIMVGGHWNMKHIWSRERVEAWGTWADNHLLLSKFLWRQGFVRIPESCSADTPGDECMPHCPAEITGSMTAREVLKAGRVWGDNGWSAQMNESFATYVPDTDNGEVEDLTDADLLDELCHVGYPGEMFTSSAPQDPIFWPLHGNAERFVQALRHYKDQGNITFDETWSYEHIQAPSDTHLVCDWEGVEGYGMPTCATGTCPGHKADDLLPFEGLHWAGGVQRMTYSNQEFYDAIDPLNTDMPYVYDSVLHWAACDDSSLYTMAVNSGYL